MHRSICCHDKIASSNELSKKENDSNKKEWGSFT